MENEESFVRQIAERLAAVPGVEAVALGGSRATGEQRPDSDFDFAIYYRGHLDPNDIRNLGWPGVVSAVGEWGGGVMNGGAWLRISGLSVDVHYRDLDDVEHHLAEAEAGRFKVERLPFYLAGIPTYVVAGELAVGHVLVGSLPRPTYPAKLREQASLWWHGAALLSLNYAEKTAAEQGDPVGVAGGLARAVVEEAHSRLAARGEWVLNEKRIVERAGLQGLSLLFACLGADAPALRTAVARVRAELAPLTSD